MSRSLYKVTKKLSSISPQSDPEQAAGVVQIDIATLLSRKFGKTIRQGNNFRIAGASAHIVPSGSNYDLDSGLAAKIRLGYCPTTKHSRKGWNLLFDHWKKQKQLRGAVGAHMRYDDFEMAIHSDYIDTRTSTIFTEGMGDTTSESIVIYTDTDDGHNPNDHIGLQAYYNKRFPIADRGEIPQDDLLSDWTMAKQAKFFHHFPDREWMGLSALFSAQSYHDPDLILDDHWMEPTGSYNENMFFDGSHINVMCGVMSCAVYILPEADVDVIEDELDLYITLWVEGWTPLVNKKRSPRRLSYKRKSRKGGRKRGYSRRK